MRAMRRLLLLLSIIQGNGLLLTDEEFGDDGMSVVFAGQRGTKPRVPHARRVYFDLGANWANTLRLYEDLAPRPEVEEHPWEIYAFEASPLIMPYLDDFVAWLNGQAPKPRLLWPPAGSTAHLRSYAKRFGCPNSAKRAELRDCMWNVFKEPLKQMVPNMTLMSPDVINARMALAASPPAEKADRFVLIPAAAGASTDTLHIGAVSAQSMIRGGVQDTDVYHEDQHQFDVPMANFVSMLDSFRDTDYVMVKMDIEGGEFPILEALVAQNKTNLIDMLLLECHPQKHRSCPETIRKWKDASGVEPRQEGHGYKGWDSKSMPGNYYPEDPRTASTPAR